MPPHCDTLDGPVVQAAKKAIEEINVLYVLPWVPVEAETEVREAFENVQHARNKHPDAEKVADQWFYETVVRLHRLGEGEPYTGLKPAGLDPGPAFRLAEKALEIGQVGKLDDFFEDAIEATLTKKLHRTLLTDEFDWRDTPAARKHVQAKLSFFHLVNDLYQLIAKAEQEEKVKTAEESAKEKITNKYQKKHPDTVEAITHHHH